MINNENILANYKVFYIGGLREFPTDPKFLKTQIILNVYGNKLEFEPKNDFPGTVVLFDNIQGIHLSRRNLQGGEILGLGLLSVATKVMNNINIKCAGENGNSQNLVFEMISGGTIWGTVKNCNELLSLVPINPPVKQQTQTPKDSKGNFDSIIQTIEKLSNLKEQGILTEEEFLSKKKSLLQQLP